MSDKGADKFPISAFLRIGRIANEMHERSSKKDGAIYYTHTSFIMHFSFHLTLFHVCYSPSQVYGINGSLIQKEFAFANIGNLPLGRETHSFVSSTKLSKQRLSLIHFLVWLNHA